MSNYYDNGKIQIWLGVTGWCFTTTDSACQRAGGVGYGSESAALAAARQK
jgi:hypothetical protein